MLTLYTFAVVELQLRVAVPDVAMLPGVMALQVSPAGTVSVRVTVPVKPFRAVTVIVEVRDAPTLPVGDVAVILKSAGAVTTNVAVAE